MPKATVIIPNINGKAWLRESIESIYAQTEQDFVLVVVDNGSTDESLADARSYCSRPNFILIENDKNTGFSHAVNQGIAQAQSEFVVLFNNDAFAESDWLAQLINAAQKDEKIFSVQSLMIRHFERDKIDDAGDSVNIFGFAFKNGNGENINCYKSHRRIFSSCGGAVLYRKRILDEIGTFDEHFFAYLEDIDLGWRANNEGYKNVLCPDARCYHISGASTGAVQYNRFKAVQNGRNGMLLPLKNQPIVMLLVNCIPLVAGYVLKRWAFVKKGYKKDWDTGMREAFGLLRQKKIHKRPFRLCNIPHYLLVELWMIYNVFTYLWSRCMRAYCTHETKEQ